MSSVIGVPRRFFGDLAARGEASSLRAQHDPLGLRHEEAIFDVLFLKILNIFFQCQELQQQVNKIFQNLEENGTHGQLFPGLIRFIGALVY